MNLDYVLGILVITVAYGITWYLLVKSANIVHIIDREGLTSTRAIKRRLKQRGVPTSTQEI
jgi:hypothetical protein